MSEGWRGKYWSVDDTPEVRTVTFRGQGDRTLPIAGAAELASAVRQARKPLKGLVIVMDVLHADLKEVREMSEGRPISDWAPWLEALTAIESHPSIVVVAIPRQATCGGLELSLAADVRIASPTARLGLMETQMGILPGAGGTQRLPELVGFGNAALLVLTGMTISGETASRMGLVQLCDHDPIRAAVRLVQHCSSLAPGTIPAAKAALQSGRVRSPDGFAEEGRAFLSIVGTASTRDRLDRWIAAQTTGRNPALGESLLP